MYINTVKIPGEVFQFATTRDVITPDYPNFIAVHHGLISAGWRPVSPFSPWNYVAGSGDNRVHISFTSESCGWWFPERPNEFRMKEHRDRIFKLMLLLSGDLSPSEAPTVAKEIFSIILINASTDSHLEGCDRDDDPFR